jgi:hypothetical protein
VSTGRLRKHIEACNDPPLAVAPPPCTLPADLMTPLRRLIPRVTAMILTALVLAWGFAEFAPLTAPEDGGSGVKSALVVTGAAGAPLVGPMLLKFLNAERR